jgi:hypothetical protein
MLVVMVILHVAEFAVIGVCSTYLWGYYVPAVKKEVLEKTGIELPLPDSPLRSLLNMVLAPFAEMWTQYWALPWTVWGALVHLAVLLFLGSVFKTQAKDFQWLVGASCRRGLTLLNWVGQFGLKCMNRVFTAAPAAPAPAAPATKKSARGKSPGRAAAVAAPAAAAPAPVAAAPVPAPAAPAPVPAPAVKKARAKSPAPAVKKAPAKSPVREQAVIKVGTEVLSKHKKYGNKKFAAKVVSIVGVWHIIAWKDKDPDDILKHVDELTVKIREEFD